MSKKSALIGVIVVCILIYAIMTIIPALCLRFPILEVETVRVSSPDNKFDAVIIERDAGAMSSAEYLVYIVRSGQKPTENDKNVFGATRAYDLRIKWERGRELLIQYEKADIYQFRNYLYPFDDDLNYKISIREVQDGKE